VPLTSATPKLLPAEKLITSVLCVGKYLTKDLNDSSGRPIKLGFVTNVLLVVYIPQKNL